MDKEYCEKLKDLFLLMDIRNKPTLSAEEEQRKKELEDLFNYYSFCSRQLSDYYHLQKPSQIKFNFSNIVPRFMQLLRESVLTHQWHHALRIVLALTREAKGTENTESTLWKIGLSCLYQHGEKSSRLVEQFVKQVVLLKKLAVVEVMLDYLLYLLMQSNYEDAKNLILDLKQSTMFPSQLTNDRRCMAHTLFFAYEGIVLYAEWKLATYKLDEEDNDSDIFYQKMSQGASVKIAETLAESATELLIKIKDKPGVWDICITKLVEIYEYYGNIEEARTLLHSYRDRNVTNPNAHRYLYQFENKLGENEEIQLACLKKIVQLDPCNPMCLELYTLTKNDPESVVYLFDYLDYDHCCENETVWELLSLRLQEMNHSQLNVVRDCWSTRSDWWPVVRLSKRKKTQSFSHSLKRHKKIVFKILSNLDCDLDNSARDPDLEEETLNYRSSIEHKKRKFSHIDAHFDGFSPSKRAKT
ncbi:TATA box-binding protein-associated factor RNA polymerase I subunit A-like [Physella acuta]|uniref:TATA box-binding protein-associated factor RNA polymerase I subunit A-like n=1 Tax=Physella acuta TaxID=109671 RepID=UPI0027DDECAD|nr:TATA box-binding protein-associated factor RNA polymerase I subunit A-like [Physella acuta]